MKLLKSCKLWSLVVGSTIFYIVWKGLIIDHFPNLDNGGLWAFGIVTYIIVAAFQFRKDINSLVDKWDKHNE